MRSQWFHPISWPGYGEVELLERVRAQPALQVPDHDPAAATLLYGPRGEVLLQRQPRRVGFRPPRVVR